MEAPNPPPIRQCWGLCLKEKGEAKHPIDIPGIHKDSYVMMSQEENKRLVNGLKPTNQWHILGLSPTY